MLLPEDGVGNVLVVTRALFKGSFAFSRALFEGSLAFSRALWYEGKDRAVFI